MNITLGSGKAVHHNYVMSNGENLGLPECGGNRASERYYTTNHEVTCKKCLKALVARVVETVETAEVVETPAAADWDAVDEALNYPTVLDALHAEALAEDEAMEALYAEALAQNARIDRAEWKQRTHRAQVSAETVLTSQDNVCTCGHGHKVTECMAECDCNGYRPSGLDIVFAPGAKVWGVRNRATRETEFLPRVSSRRASRAARVAAVRRLAH